MQDVSRILIDPIRKFLFDICSFLQHHQIVRQYKSFNKLEAGGKLLKIKDFVLTWSDFHAAFVGPLLGRFASLHSDARSLFAIFKRFS